ncbi:DUF6482 family protein [Vibrio europaeus]|uniref:DUF6482 family protein n=1 Tax=Vibrio europaeus TaxID=300876 RepID=UPI00233EED98|nr:DUF6482 family protein [Vibrio europaeus]MDC5808034.1 DUF6482 family protein [Vibrio europaeus]MDC5825250.1 DUF6482 family protein [Vibrio europaeus]MDC5830860.1 DUF6482 family protein [Vibrio europaeus]MDC5833815.1 DUF6482 family protein [Vibrio europaeus]
MDLELELIEGGCYLAVEIRGDERRILRSNTDAFIKYQNLSQARAHLAQNNYASITLIEHNTYDEMCGECVNQEVTATRLDWS